MRNRCKTLLRDHSVLEVMPKACPRHYSVSAMPYLRPSLLEDLKDLPVTGCNAGWGVGIVRGISLPPVPLQLS